MKKNNNKVIKVFCDDKIRYYNYNIIMTLQRLMGLLLIVIGMLVAWLSKGEMDNGSVLIICGILGCSIIFTRKPWLYLGGKSVVVTKERA